MRKSWNVFFNFYFTDSIKSWNIFYDYFIYELDDREDESDFIYVVYL